MTVINELVDLAFLHETHSSLSFRPNRGPHRARFWRDGSRREESALAREKRYYVYIMVSKGRVLYVGMTGFLVPRVLQHKAGETDGFTRRYHVTRLVFYESFRYVNNAIARETEVKKWRREKKVALIEEANPAWRDLAEDWRKRMTMRRADSSLRSE